ncbi:hypothetical protein [Paenarthrobacter sp. A20]|uniref:hypothetical protein n=1 Tax=Micrococcaceae TaxID=1268 RepID=UPI0035A8C238|nr:hypothetical protein [Paenarthrobacter sp. A20]
MTAWNADPDAGTSEFGLVRYGFVKEASRVASGLFDAAEHFSGQLPELFPAPLQLARILLRSYPDFTRNVLHLAPILPDSFGTFTADNDLLGRSMITIQASGSSGNVTGHPLGWS